MTRKRYTPEQIIRKLRDAEVLISHGTTAVNAARQIGVVELTYYRWRKDSLTSLPVAMPVALPVPILEKPPGAIVYLRPPWRHTGKMPFRR